MKVWTCNKFKGHWPVGSAAVVVAKDQEQARQLLAKQLALYGLKQEVTPEMLDPLPVCYPMALVLNDGNY